MNFEFGRLAAVARQTENPQEKPRLSLTLLGGFEARLAPGGAVELPGQKDRALLAFLAMASGNPLARERPEQGVPAFGTWVIASGFQHSCTSGGGPQWPNSYRLSLALSSLAPRQ